MKVESSSFLVSKHDLLVKLIDRLKEKYQYCSVLAADCKAKSYSVSARGISIEEVPMFSQRGFVVRVADSIGYAEYSFNELEEGSIEDVIARIDSCIIPLTEVIPDGIRSMERKVTEDEPLRFVKSTEYLVHPDELGDDGIIRLLSDIRTEAMSGGKLIECIASASTIENHKMFVSDVKDLEQNILFTSGAMVTVAAKGKEMKDYYKSFSGLGGVEALDKMKDAVGVCVNTVLELLDSEPIAPGEYECVCDPDVTGMIVHEAFGHGVEMDMFVKDRAIAKYHVGDRVASDLVTMHDASCDALEAGTYFFDDEGTPAHDTVIIEKGILKRGISDRLSAEALGTEPTGNGRRQDYTRKAYTRMTNTYFCPGSDKVEDMIASVKDGFLLENPSSGMEDPKNWGIQCMVNIAREIKDGKLTGKIYSPIVLTGFVPDLLKSITMMSGETFLAGGGYCGKGYKEWVKVSDGGPYIKAKIRLG